MNRLRELRNSKGLSQLEVATELGITQQAYANYERGAREADYDTLKKLSDIFDVSIDFILCKTDISAPLAQQLSDQEFALWGELHDLDDDEKQDILDYIKFKKSQRKPL